MKSLLVENFGLLITAKAHVNLHMAQDLVE